MPPDEGAPPDEGLNAGYALVLYANYLADPASIDPDWRDYFERYGPPVDGRFAREPAPVPPPLPAADLDRATSPAVVAAAMELVRAYRDFGHLAARLDPLGGAPPGDPSLDPATHGLDDGTMRTIPASILGLALPEAQVSGATLADVLPALRATYAGTIAYEVSHIASHRERAWLRREIETGAHRVPLEAKDQRRLLERLTAVEALEHYLGRAYLGQKRFSVEGLDVLVPMLDLVIELAADGGAREVVLGMAHRGRLNVLAHIVGVGYEAIFEEFEAGADIEQGRIPRGPTDDVKYHHGARGTYRRRSGGEVSVSIVPNPSHLEAVDPVVEGRARAVQTDRGVAGAARHDPAGALAALIHGDAAFAAQGVVAETFNLARLPGYATGGTLHLIANNQIGFTTSPREARSTDFASDLAKGFDVPIVHVNADDPEACLAAVRLAMAYRGEFGGDVVVDVVGYRRYGHNEGDEPAYTQPLMAERIRETPSVRQRYVERLSEAGATDAATAERQRSEAFELLDAVRERVRAADARRWSEKPETEAEARADAEPETGVPADVLAEVNRALLAVPKGFTVHPKLAGPLGRRSAALEPSGRVDWGLAEVLAFGTLLRQAVPVRITGQDTERGTFSQRHLALFDVRTGERYAPLEHLADARAAVEIHNSPLSEFACLGFEYGYSVAAPEGLVAWEAQYGDFVNEAEVVIDQFLVAGRAKWGEASRIALLLPHGFEGQGPEHSSARLERFLALCANGNLRVAVPTTAAQYFHLLRRQALHEERRPLVVMTPKSLLRLPEAMSGAEELAKGRFQPVIPPAIDDPAGVRRLVLCSGKVYYELTRADHGGGRVAVARVELLYPFPTRELAAVIGSLPGLEQVAWAQEEPRNMGALKFVLPELTRIVPEGVVVETVARPERASPAEGYGAAHLAEQRRLVRQALRPTRERAKRSGSRDVAWR